MPELIVPIRRRGVLVKILLRPGSAHLSESPPAVRPALHVGPLSAYLDTGASDTMVDAGILHSLELPAQQSVALNVLGRAEVSFHESYDVEVALVAAGASPRWVPLTVLAGPVYATGAVAALGRDFLAHVVLICDGPKKRATVRW
jgi:hypothetical protein